MQPGAEIASEFRGHLDAYFRALDEWEQAYGRFYRIAMPNQVSADMQPQYQRFEEAKQALKRSMPQAQALCHRYGIRENWSALLRVDIHARTPQTGEAALIGRSERSVATTAITELELALLTGETTPPPPQRRKRGILNAILELF